MCLGIPGKIIEVLPETEPAGGSLRRGIVDFGGVRKEICLSCVEDAGPGDYVIVHVGFAISKIDEAEAQEVFRLLQELEEAEAAMGGPPGDPEGSPGDRPERP